MASALSSWMIFISFVHIMCGATTIDREYILKELNRFSEDPIADSTQELDLMRFIIGLQETATQWKKDQSKIHIFTGKKALPTRSITHLSDKKTRNRPQTIATVYGDRTIIVYIFGTVDNVPYDWDNRINCIPKEVTFKASNPQSIKVYEGVFEAINTELFYTELLTDIKQLISSISAQHQHEIQLIFAGHDQGGAIATLLSLLWIGDADCPFSDHFKSTSDSAIQQLMNQMHVYTFGAFGVIGHPYVTSMEHLLRSNAITITNFIDNRDPTPMIGNGEKRTVDSKYTAKSKKGLLILDKMDEFVRNAYYGPIGKYIVMINGHLKSLSDAGTLPTAHQLYPLYTAHLVHGAQTFSRYFKQMSDTKTRETRFDIAVNRHSYEHYNQFFIRYPVNWKDPFQPNGYNLYSLLDDADTIHLGSYETCNLMDFIISLPHVMADKYHNKPSIFTTRLSKKKLRNTPQTIGAVYQKNTIVIFILDAEDSNNFDWSHRMQCKPKKVQLKKPQTKEIEIYSGVFDVINTESFYESLLDDIQSMRHSAATKGHAIEQLIFAGHGYGGAIANLLSLLWIGDVQCGFVQYFKQHSPSVMLPLMDAMKVYAFGAFGVIGHDDYEYIQGITQVKRIVNIIESKDPIPMIINGHNDNVDQVCTVKKGKKNELDDFNKRAYYGPIGTYVVTLHYPTGGYASDAIVLFDATKHPQLFKEHLVDGADTFARYVDVNRERKQWAMKYHSYDHYRQTLWAFAQWERQKKGAEDKKVKRAQYEQRIRENYNRNKEKDIEEYLRNTMLARPKSDDKTKSGQATLVYVIGGILLVVVLCGLCCGFVCGYGVTKYNRKRNIYF